MVVKVHPDSYLPQAKILESTLDTGEVRRASTLYEHEFVASSELAADFLDPRSIGYGAPASAGGALDEAGRDVPVYWVGEEFTTSYGDEYVLVGASPWYYGYGTHLNYETPEGLIGFEILVFEPSAWEDFLRSELGQRLENRDCVPRSSLPGKDVPFYTIPWPEFPVSETPVTPKQVCDLVVAKEPPLVQWGHLAVVSADGAVVAVGDASGTAPTDTMLVEDVVENLQRR
jgi:hypothetical protein